MNSAARSHALHLPSRRGKQTSNTLSSSAQTTHHRESKGGTKGRRRHVPSRGGITKRARRTRPPPVRPCCSQGGTGAALSSQDQQQRPDSLSSCAQIQILPSGGCDDDDDDDPDHEYSMPNQLLLLRACYHSFQPPPNSWRAKRARTPVALGRLLRRPTPNNHSWRDWANLGDGPAGLIAERVLACDVADYLRFRAACRRWRQCSAEPRAHGCLDRRFHPRRWILLPEPLAAPSRRCFLNTSTGECIQVHLPELHDHEVLTLTSQGLLLLLHDRHHVRLLNPLTRHFTQLPPLTTLLPEEEQRHLLSDDAAFNAYFGAWGSGILNDDSTVVLCFNSLRMLGIAKPGDVCWTVLNYTSSPGTSSSMFAGRFYCVTPDGVMVLEDQPPRLELAAKMPMLVSSMTDSVHLVDSAGELMLVHRRFSRHPNRANLRRYDTYRVDLENRTICLVSSFGGGGHAMFIGMHCSLSVTTKVFPSGSIRGDTIYLSFDIEESDTTEGYHLRDRSIINSHTLNRWLAVQPHTLVDCLSLCSTCPIS